MQRYVTLHLTLILISHTLRFYHLSYNTCFIMDVSFMLAVLLVEISSIFPVCLQQNYTAVSQICFVLCL